MGYSCEIIADSLNEYGNRLTTFLVEYPLVVHNEHLRHRSQSYSVASNRAIPLARLIEKVQVDPYIPEWRHNQAGMAAAEPLSESESKLATAVWLETRNRAIEQAQFLGSNNGLNVHKQWVNRLLMPWQWITVLCTATEWDNFFALRCHPAAQPEIQRIAEMMCHAYYQNKPDHLVFGQWHLPFVTRQEKLEHPIGIQRKFAVARCARTSLLNHDKQYEPDKDVELHNRLADSRPPHASPFEHVATPTEVRRWVRNFNGWIQYRTHIIGETTRSFDYEEFCQRVTTGP